MMPPRRRVRPRDCESDHLVTFRETEAGREFARRVEEEGITGHPPDSQWFCGEHYEQVKHLTHRTLQEALRSLRRAP